MSGPNSNSAESAGTGTGTGTDGNTSIGSVGANNSTAGSTSNNNNSNNNPAGAKVQYTVWITEAWRHFEWEEPSAALFWEMATMYYTLHVAARSIEVEETELPMPNRNGNDGFGDDDDYHGNDKDGSYYGIQRTLSQTIPPILSCGSSASMDSNDGNGNGNGNGNNNGNGNGKDKKSKGDDGYNYNNNNNSKKSDSPEVSSSSYRSNSPTNRRGSTTNTTPTNNTNNNANSNGNGDKKTSGQNNKQSAASAKELPVWLVGMFLLLHCEEEAFWRNVSGEDEQRFDALMAKQQMQAHSYSGLKDILGNHKHFGAGNSNGVGYDFGMLLSAMRTNAPQMHMRLDNSNCTAYLLRHLRKFLLLACIPHNAEALVALYTLAISDCEHDEEYLMRRHGHGHNHGHNHNHNHNHMHGHGHRNKNKSSIANPYAASSTAEICERHDEEHGEYGLNVRMTSEDLERLNLILQTPSGGLIDDPPLYITDVMPAEELAVYGGISIEEVESEIRRHFERELMDDSVSVSIHGHGHGHAHAHGHVQPSPPEEKDDVDSATEDMSNLGLNEAKEGSEDQALRRGTGNNLDDEDYHKELTYTKVRGSTILLKPNPQPQLDTSMGSDAFSNNGNVSANANTSASANATHFVANNGRLHDVVVSGCSDSHMYLLQPFEHATISACSGCTIVVGAVAGLLHVVDCERTTITSAARRVLVSNCYDVTHYIFTPSPPLLVGDNRNCKFAPYNTYYDGMRDDLLATGLAAALVSPDNQVMHNPMYGPALQCASNKWKQPQELAKLSDLLQAQSIAPRSTSPIPGAAPGADEKAFSITGADDTVKIPTLVPASEFQVLLIPYLSEATQKRRARQETIEEELTVQTSNSEDNMSIPSGPSSSGIGSMYCRNLADVLQLSPFRLPKEYESRAMVKAERMKSLQTAIQTDLTPEQQIKLEEELNSGFREWLVSSGNLRQVLDLVHLERKEGSSSE